MNFISAKKTLGFNTEFRLDDNEKLSFENETFDCVIDTLGLEFTHDPVKAIREMKRVCKKDGLILLMEFGQSKNSIV